MSRQGLEKATVDGSAGPLIAALLIACLVHLILILGVDFPFPQADSDAPTTRPLEILVLRRSGPPSGKPAITDPFPQVEHTAGASQAPPATAGLDLVPEIPQIEPELTAKESALALLKSPERFMDITFFADSEHKAKPESQSKPAPEFPDNSSPESEPPQIDTAGILASRNLEVAERTARMRRDLAASANRPRRKAIDAGTHDYHYANYLEAWRLKVERVGNLNYPEAAKRHKMYGSLVLQVAIRADGSLEQVRVLRSSGFDPLDEAAVRIVELAAPFSPFPPAIRAETDVLDITRTWQFLSSNRLGWER